MLLIAGCASQPAKNETNLPPPPTPPVNNTPPPACEDYCLTQPHAQCVGNWTISGFYPHCICTFECAVTNTTNQTAPPPPPPPPPVQNVTFNVTTKTIGELLADGSSRAEAIFNRIAEPAQWQTETYQWARSNFSNVPDYIPLKQNDIMTSGTRFNGKYIDSLRGFMLKIYSADDLSAPGKIYATAVIISDTSLLDNATGDIDIEFDTLPRVGKVFEGCRVIHTEEYRSANGNPIKIYDFNCKIETER